MGLCLLCQAPPCRPHKPNWSGGRTARVGWPIDRCVGHAGQGRGADPRWACLSWAASAKMHTSSTSRAAQSRSAHAPAHDAGRGWAGPIGQYCYVAEAVSLRLPGRPGHLATTDSLDSCTNYGAVVQHYLHYSRRPLGGHYYQASLPCTGCVMQYMHSVQNIALGSILQ